MFKDELECSIDVEAKFQSDDSVEPRFLKSRLVLYHISLHSPLNSFGYWTLNKYYFIIIIYIRGRVNN